MDLLRWPVVIALIKLTTCTVHLLDCGQVRQCFSLRCVSPHYCVLFKGRGRGKGGLTEQPKRDKSPQQTLPPKQTSKGMSCHIKVALVV